MNIVINETNRSINIKENVIYVNGEVHTNLNTVSDKIITITVMSDCNKLDTTSGNVEVQGKVEGNINTMSGDVTVKGDVQSYVKTMSGDVRANTIKGSTSTMSGDICVKKSS